MKIEIQASTANVTNMLIEYLRQANPSVAMNRLADAAQCLADDGTTSASTSDIMAAFASWAREHAYVLKCREDAAYDLSELKRQIGQTKDQAFAKAFVTALTGRY